MYVIRTDLMRVLMDALEEELSDKTVKERRAVAETIVDHIDGQILTVVDEEEDDGFDADDDDPFDLED